MSKRKKKILLRCEKCMIIFHNNHIYNTLSNFDDNLCVECYEKYTGMSNCCDYLIENGRCSNKECLEMCK